jgi:hypothetical protein
MVFILFCPFEPSSGLLDRQVSAMSRDTEKGGVFAKSRLQNRYASQNCPKIKKGALRPFLTIFGTGMRAKIATLLAVISCKKARPRQRLG